MTHQTATVIATVKPTPGGAHLRLDYYGQNVASIPLPISRGEDLIDAADRALAEHGWRTVEPWGSEHGAAGAEWLAYVDRTEEV